MNKTFSFTAKGLDALTAPGRYRDTKVTGFNVQVTRAQDGSVRRSFGYRYSINGRTREMGLGSYTGDNLGAARDRAKAAADQCEKGIDPLAAKAAPAPSLPTSQTFAEAEQAYLKHLKAQKAGTKFPLGTLLRWESTLRRFVLPKIGPKDVREIRHSDIAGILAPLSLVKETNKVKGAGGPTIAHQLRSRIERILDFAAAHGFRDPDAPNPARPQLLKVVLGNAAPSKHHAAPPVSEARELFARIHSSDASIYRAAEFLVLTVTRLRETLDARWEEVDFATATWTLPARRMKTGVAHIVPLSTGALDVLHRQAALRQNEWVFPGRYGSPWGSSSLAKALAKIGIKYTLHGWRSVARDTMADVLDVDRETAEMVLAHVTKGVEGAYRRATALDKRRVAMERYGAWLAGASNVVPLHAASA
jgi:integrase